MDTCEFHPNHSAIEHCEVCDKPLCGLCLWYTDDGHRLCETHAKDRESDGQKVLPPHTYHEAIEGSLVRKEGDPAGTSSSSSSKEKLYKGNSTDLNAFVAGMIGIVTIASCSGGAYCLPLVAVVLGFMAYRNAEQAIDPKRTRTMAMIGMGVGALILAFVFAVILLYVFVFAAAFASTGGP